MTVNDVVAQIDVALEQRGLSQMELSRLTNVPQSTISRSLSTPVRLTKTHQKLCIFLGIRIDQREGASGAEVLRKAAFEVWDGSDSHAHALAALLKAAARVCAVQGARKP